MKVKVVKVKVVKVKVLKVKVVYLAPEASAVRKARSRELAPSSGFGYSTETLSFTV